MFVEKSGLGPSDKALVTLEADGGVEIVTGAASLGQGIETVMAQICAEVLDIPIERMRVVHGRTDRIDFGMGAFASRVTVMTGCAVKAAAEALKEKLNSAKPPVSAEGWFRSSHMTYPYGVHAAVVRVDEATSAVVLERLVVAYDIGRAVNPMLVEGQLAGGAVQGIGGALLEEFVYDEGGQPLATTFATTFCRRRRKCRRSRSRHRGRAEPAQPPRHQGGGRGRGQRRRRGDRCRGRRRPRPALAVTRLPLTPRRLHRITVSAKAQI